MLLGVCFIANRHSPPSVLHAAEPRVLVDTRGDGPVTAGTSLLNSSCNQWQKKWTEGIVLNIANLFTSQHSRPVPDIKQVSFSYHIISVGPHVPITETCLSAVLDV